MIKFIVLKTYIGEVDVAVIAQEVHSIEQGTDVNGLKYTRVEHCGTKWVKVKESVSEIVDKIHFALNS